MNDKQAHHMDCLNFCLHKMNDSLFELANTNTGKALLQLLKRVHATTDARVKEYILFYIAYWRAPGFSCSHQDLIDAATKNFKLLMSNLTSMQQIKLNALFQ